ncbi:MAG: aminotransferase class I/II-fold pyridoxal phosphate-dependent enzyme [Clostridia bacterium]|nr:aminotransferase class I/II-fold pyridoxal phosphate-dependent enzyme [Clostridia bacterium]
MNYTFSDKASQDNTGIFARLTAKRDALLAQGRKVYNLYIGTPDFPTPEHIVKAVADAALKPENFKYALTDIPQLADALIGYYDRRYGVTITKEEFTSVNGSQDGIGHLGLALCNPEDYVLLPDPGYPVFEAGVKLADAKIYYYKLLAENNFLPNMESIPEEILNKTKYMIVSYPSNPCGAAAPREMYASLIEYANKYQFYIVNDNAYSDIIFDGREGYSFLSVPGAKEVGIEFFSLSKSYNTTGARISFAVGNKHIVNAIKTIRSQYDFGMFLPIQYGAVAALTGETDSVRAQCREYQRRRDALCGGFRKIGWNVPDSQGTMFVWAPVPKQYKSSEEFWEVLIDKAGILCTPGSSFGPAGEGYVRFALVKPAEELAEIAEIVGKSGII